MQIPAAVGRRSESIGGRFQAKQAQVSVPTSSSLSVHISAIPAAVPPPFATIVDRSTVPVEMEWSCLWPLYRLEFVFDF
jgi:hypothetical protein